ncbi:MAG: pentapeptide repeat-containing protein [Cyanobacteria bacterium P01_E01_bin.48]
MYGANLSRADLQDAVLNGANLRNACLHGCNLSRTRYTSSTRFPDGFDPVRAGMLKLQLPLRRALSAAR